jgi:DNA repair photolyase
MFIPKRVFITRNLMGYPSVNDIIRKVQLMNPSADIQYCESSKPDLPEELGSSDRHQYMKETMVISERTSSFIETFASPGHIVENLGTMVKTSFNCPSHCQYCYLQRTALRQKWQRIYVNIEKLESEMLNELYVHRLLRTLLSSMSIASGESYDKIPEGFKVIADEIRKELSNSGKKTLDDNLSLNYLRDNVSEIFQKLNLEISEENEKLLLNKLPGLFEESKSHPLWFNVSEYTDVAALNHISGHLEYFMKLIDKNKDLRIKFFTKSPNLEGIIGLNADRRVKIVINLNTEHIINTYESGTSSLDERMETAKKLQANGSFVVDIQIEPIIKCEGYLEDYEKLIDRVFTELNPNEINKVTLGCVRYAPQLIGVIKKNYPDTDLFDPSQELSKPEQKYDRYRYFIEERVNIYSKLIDLIKERSPAKIGLGSETPELWEQIKMAKISV